MNDIRKITIVNLDINKTKKSESGLYDIAFILSEVPPTEWVEIFYRVQEPENRKNIRHYTARIDGKILYIDYPIDEADNLLKEALQKNIDEVNKIYNEKLAERREYAKNIQTKKEEEKNKIIEMKKKMEF